MELVKVAENALTLELSWADCTLLAHLCRPALEADALGDVPAYAMTDGYARALVALFEAGGLASWAYTVRRDRFTIEHFREVVPLTRPDPSAGGGSTAPPTRRPSALPWRPAPAWRHRLAAPQGATMPAR